jgi:hypothetical protein
MMAKDWKKATWLTNDDALLQVVFSDALGKFEEDIKDRVVVRSLESVICDPEQDAEEVEKYRNLVKSLRDEGEVAQLFINEKGNVWIAVSIECMNLLFKKNNCTDTSETVALSFEYMKYLIYGAYCMIKSYDHYGLKKTRELFFDKVLNHTMALMAAKYSGEGIFTSFDEIKKIVEGDEDESTGDDKE